ncbi:glycosyl hydrolase family 28-related protein [Streptomyces sp. NPDC002574]|uniref:glycosyl hydrolase family 28-related protein n=1 Tax=Streptomyces sp. NPDC002574 TaxID=3364652 RepID=UPI00368E7F10
MSGVDRRKLIYGGAAAALTGIGAAACSAAATPAAEAVPRPRSTTRPGVVDVVADFGAKGDGTTDDSRAFADAYRYAESRLDDHTGRTVIDVPPGKYLITEPGALLAGDNPRNQANGLRFRGAGLRISEIVFAPEKADGAFLCVNDDMWQNIAFEGLRFTSGTPGASFFSSYSTGGAANYRFGDCEWMGEWEYGIALDGTNTNSEMRWEACRVGGAYRKAFLYSGLSRRSAHPEQQDQFLNYWFTDMNVTYEWGNFLEFPYGGSVTCRAGSYVVTGRRPVPHPDYGYESAFFRFPRSQHFSSVQRFHAEDIRFELRGPDTVVIDCEWSGGTVHFNDCDDTANAFKSFAPGLRAHRYTLGPRGPLVRYDSCQLTGAHQFRTRAEARPPVCVRYDMCLLASHGPEDGFLVLDDGQDGGFARFVDCVTPS